MDNKFSNGILSVRKYNGMALTLPRWVWDSEPEDSITARYKYIEIRVFRGHYSGLVDTVELPLALF